MSEVKRYAYGFHDDGYGGGRTLGLIEREDGELVTFADFDAQAAENARLRADNEALYRGLKGKHATTGATYEHLAAERDALRAQLAAIQGGMGENIEPCTDLNHHERYRAGWNACRAAMLAAAPAQGHQVEFGDAYPGAREDLAIWKRRALEAEEKLRAQCDDQSFMGEPLVQPYDAPREKIEALFKQLGFNGQVSVGEILDAALTALKAQQVGQEPAVPECVERIRTLLPRFEAGVNWTGEDTAELAEAAYDAAELLTTRPAPAQDVACQRCAARDELDRKIEEQQA